jgi:transcriptional regulator with XRE-family HTH domain
MKGLRGRRYKLDDGFPNGTWERVAASTFGSYLRERRIQAGFSRATLARQSGISLAMIENLEHNRVPPDDADIRLLAAALGIEETEVLVQAGYVLRSDSGRLARPTKRRIPCPPDVSPGSGSTSPRGL